MDVSVWTRRETRRLYPKHPQALGGPGVLHPTAPRLPGAGTSNLQASPASVTMSNPMRMQARTWSQTQQKSSSLCFTFLKGNLGGASVANAPGRASALSVCLAGWASSGESSNSRKRLNLQLSGCREAPGSASAGERVLQGGGDLPMHCCGSADRIRHRWATQSCHNQPGFENVIIGMVNKFTRTLLRQGIAMVTDQKSLGRRKVSISGGSGRGGAVGAPGMLPAGSRAGRGPRALPRRAPLSGETPLIRALSFPRLSTQEWHPWGCSLQAKLGSSPGSLLELFCSLAACGKIAFSQQGPLP